MSFIKEEGTYRSSNGLYDVKYFVYKPEGEIKAMIQLIHGMAEHIERYEEWFEGFTNEGFLVYGDNHIGHKYSVRSDADLGFFAENDGWKCMVEDEITLTEIMKESYPNLKCFLYGHSMGSFIARAYIAVRSDHIDGAVICGTAGPNPALGAGKVVTKLIKIFAAKKPSPMLNNVMFGSYAKHIDNPRTPFDWLTRDEAVVDKYIADPYCGFLFTSSGYLDLENLLGYVTAKDWYDKVPTDLPVFFISGEEDPVGEWGKGLKTIDEGMKKTVRADYSMKLYPGMRHELHNEIGKEEVQADLLEWFKKHV